MGVGGRVCGVGGGGITFGGEGVWGEKGSGGEGEWNCWSGWLK